MLYEWKKALKISFVLIWYLKPAAIMLYDGFDVMLDFYYFYKLEMLEGNLLDNRITRNTHVNNAILAFAILGFLKCALICAANNYIWVHTQRAFRKLSNSPQENKAIVEGCKQGTVVVVSAGVALIALIFEDGVEIVLEYFYADKYASKSSWYILVNATVMVVKDLLLLLSDLKEFFTKLFWSGNRKYSVKRRQYGVMYVFMKMPLFFIATSKIFRAICSWQQSRTGIINKNCLEVIGGALIQTPFAKDCLTSNEQSILNFVIISGFFVLNQMFWIAFFAKRYPAKFKSMMQYRK